jgi:hypothetical protein
MHLILSFKHHVFKASRGSVGQKHVASVEGINKILLRLTAEGMSIFRMELQPHKF